MNRSIEHKLFLGDVVGVPLADDRLGAIVFLGKASLWGEAWGLLRENWKRSDGLGEGVKFRAYHRTPFFMDRREARAVGWKIVANIEDPSEMFEEPAMLYDPKKAPVGLSYGKYGLLGRSDGSTVELTRQEAKRRFFNFGGDRRVLFAPEEVCAILSDASSRKSSLPRKKQIPRRKGS